MLPPGQTQIAGVGNHGAVVGGKFRTREVHAHPEFFRKLLQALTQLQVGADAASHHQLFRTAPFQRPLAFDGQHIYRGFLERSGDVGDEWWCESLVFHRGDHGGFQATETEVEPRVRTLSLAPLGHGARKRKSFRVSIARRLCNRRTTRVAEAEELGGFVEGLAHRIVHGFTQNGVLPQRLYIGEQRMTAGDE